MKKNNEIIQLSIPNLSMEILPLLEETLHNGWVSTGGRFIRGFEEKVKSFTGIDNAVALHSGTAGLHLALKVLGLEPEEEVIVPTVTFIAAVNPVVYMNSHPVFMDCDDTLNMDLDKVEDFLENACDFENGKVMNRKTGRIVKGIIIVHVFGNPIDMKRVMGIKEKYDLFILEDATEALGSFIEGEDGKSVHCGGFGDIGVLSFNANKIITTGGGGMILTNNKEYADKIRHLSVQAKLDNPFFEHDEVGYNYRISNLHAALGYNQMDHLPEFLETKKRNYNLYKTLIRDIRGLHLMPFNVGTSPNYWFYSLYVDEKEYGCTRDQLLIKLEENGIITRPIWDLIHRQKPYENEEHYRIEKALHFVEHILNIPCSTSLTEEQVKRVSAMLMKLGRNK